MAGLSDGTLPGRSPVPDLLFEEDQFHRLEEIKELLLAPELLAESTPMHRLTVFLTYACNLACPYCKTIVRRPEDIRRFPQKGLTMQMKDFQCLIERYQGTPIRHLHFTGGEATLVASLPEMICFAKAKGIPFVSLTSNGVKAADFYWRLAEAGLDELRISLDAAEPEVGLRLTQKKHAWQQTVNTLQQFKLRRQKLPFYLIINAVISADNRKQIPELLRFLVDICEPDDIKLITEVDSKEALADFPEYQQVMGALRAFLENYPERRFPLLRRKIKTVFAADAIGLEGIAEDLPAWRCFIPLTERTVDSMYYYPCSVYLREGGAPLGKLSDNTEIQRQKSLAFVTREDCLRDVICRQYCLHCTRSYNELGNRYV